MKHEPENLTLAHEETPASRTDKGVGSGPWFASLFKRHPKPEAKREAPWWEADWQKVREQYPVGRSFDYLGRTMLVAQYDYEWRVMYLPPMPQMTCEYADDGGRLRKWVFYPHMSALLLANTPVTDAEPPTPANTRAQGPRSV